MSHTISDSQVQNLLPSSELDFRKKVVQQFVDAAARIVNGVPSVNGWNEMRHLLGVNLKAMNDAADGLNVKATLVQGPPNEPESIIPLREIKPLAFV